LQAGEASDECRHEEEQEAGVIALSEIEAAVLGMPMMQQQGGSGAESSQSEGWSSERGPHDNTARAAAEKHIEESVTCSPSTSAAEAIPRLTPPRLGQQARPSGLDGGRLTSASVEVVDEASAMLMQTPDPRKVIFDAPRPGGGQTMRWGGSESRGGGGPSCVVPRIVLEAEEEGGLQEEEEEEDTAALIAKYLSGVTPRTIDRLAESQETPRS